jgi:hypothetical protein
MTNSQGSFFRAISCGAFWQRSFTISSERKIELQAKERRCALLRLKSYLKAIRRSPFKLSLAFVENVSI